MDNTVASGGNAHDNLPDAYFAGGISKNRANGVDVSGQGSDSSSFGGFTWSKLIAMQQARETLQSSQAEDLVSLFIPASDDQRPKPQSIPSGGIVNLNA